MRKAVIFLFTFAGKVTHNFCVAGWLFYLSHCQIWADDNLSTYAFTSGKSYWWNRRSNNIAFAWFHYTSHIY